MLFKESVSGSAREFTLRLLRIGTGMLAVPVLAGSGAYVIPEAAKWRSASLNLEPKLAGKFYAIIGVSIAVGLAFDFAGFSAVKMLFWSAILNGLLAPPLVVMVVLLTSDKKVMGHCVNSFSIKMLGWACALIYERGGSGAALVTSLDKAACFDQIRKPTKLTVSR